MGTHAHKLTKLKPADLPRRFIVLSAQPCVEYVLGKGRQLVHTLRLGALKALRRDGSVHWSEWDDVFDSTERLLTLIDKYTTRREPTWIVCHRLAYQWTICGLGLAGLSRRVEVLGYNFSSRVQTAMLKIGCKRVHLVDSENYLDKDLAWIAAALGARKVVAPEDTDADSDALDKARLECNALAAMVQALCDISGSEMQGAWGWSLGSLAWHSFRAGLMTDPIHIHADPEATALERASYLGGRNECRFIGSVTGPVHVVDYNSLYASCMVDNLMPCKLIGVHGETVGSLLRGIESGLLAIASVTVDAKFNDYPCLLWPGKSQPREGRSPLPPYCAAATQWRRVWTRGICDSTLSTPELRRAVETGELSAVGRVAWYGPANPFERFIRYWYKKRLKYREEKAPFQEAVCKRVLTILPGKLGQHSRDWTDCPGVHCRNMTGHWWDWDPVDGDWKVYRALNGLAQVYGRPGEWRHAAPAISAHVTSAARVATDNAVAIAGACDCFYFDTDAQHVTGLGLQRLAEAGLLHETQLGRLKLKGSYNGGTWRNARDFTLNAGGGRCESGSICSGAVRVADERNAADGATHGCPGTDDKGQSQPAVLSGGHLYNLFRAGTDAWRSCVAVTALKRFRYSGRVDKLGWVQPLVVNKDPSGELPFQGVQREMLG